MDFADSTVATAKNLAAVGYRGRERADGSPVITVGLLGNDGLFVGGGNLPGNCRIQCWYFIPTLGLFAMAVALAIQQASG
jgi:hypothetical protein